MATHYFNKRASDFRVFYIAKIKSLQHKKIMKKPDFDK